VAAAVEVRAARAADAPFLVDCIIGAEKSGTDKLSYSTIFGIPEPELRRLLLEMLEEDIEGQELCVSGFKVAQVDGVPAGGICAWVEGQGTRSSSLLKASLLHHFFGRERIAAAAPNLALMQELLLARQPGALQLESVYVAPGYRGHGLCGRLLEAHLEAARGAQTPPALAQIILAGTNDAALQAYRRAGFTLARERSSAEPRVLKLLPAATKVLLQKDLSGGAAAPTL
jgi:ribosomal protein S18 acetylase RimI-like enzyme